MMSGANLASDPTQTKATDVDELRALLTAQQKQIEELRSALEAQKKVIEKLAPAQTGDTQFSLPNAKKLGEIATTSPVLPAAPAPLPAPQASGNVAEEAAPLQLKIGNAFITPIGFMDMTAVSRSTNPGSGIGTNFGSIPYGNVQLGSLTETRLSIQNSRLGARFDSSFHGFNVLGYWESDFLGQLGNPPNGGLAVSSNPYVFRMRLYWVDVSKGKWDFLAGQSWSLLTPNRKGISPLPGDLFFSQDIDVNYQAGLVWGRIPGFRGTVHLSDKATFAVALENSEPYIGGGNGGSAAVLPAAIAAASNVAGTQINNGSSVISSAALMPDIIAKLALDPSKKFHFEIAGVEVTNQFSNPVSTPAFQKSTKAGGGVALNLNFELAKNFRVFTNNFLNDGAGRYIFGQAPDFIIRANGDLSLVRSLSTVTGFEATMHKTMLYAYYGGVYINKNLTVDTNGKFVGYGPISSDGQNRSIQEITFGTNTTLAKDSKWGALNLMFQYSYLQRNPWLATGTAPTNANLSMGFVNLRYSLPGAAPSRK
ncbi:MAG: hypothetical protein ABSH47_16455 [Bryobacteraceae bacterium]|jgi:hypothetical protein